MISLITTTHRRPDLLYRCIKAAQNSSLQNYEHIIVADRCDKAEKVVEFVNDNRIKFYRTPESRPNNVGAIGKNIAISASNSNFICYCDDDNIILPNALEVFYNYLSRGFDYIISRHYVEHIPPESGSTKIILQKPLLSNSKELSRDDMLVYAHTKNISNIIGPWMPYSHPDFQSIMDPVGGNSVSEDGEYMRRLHAASNNKSIVDDITAIYYARNACQRPDYEYDMLYNNLSQNDIFVYPEFVI